MSEKYRIPTCLRICTTKVSLNVQFENYFLFCLSRDFDMIFTGLKD